MVENLFSPFFSQQHVDMLTVNIHPVQVGCQIQYLTFLLTQMQIACK